MIHVHSPRDIKVRTPFVTHGHLMKGLSASNRPTSNSPHPSPLCPTTNLGQQQNFAQSFSVIAGRHSIDLKTNIIKRSTTQRFHDLKCRFSSKSWSPFNEVKFFRPRSRAMMKSHPSRTVRIKKLSKNHTQPVLREDQLDASEYESLHTSYEKVDSGVEKLEEKVRFPSISFAT
jgi:hypothetical protein